jgi:glycolate oxidase
VSEVPRILRFSPVALEMLDHTVVSHGEKNMHRQFSTDTGCILSVEFAGDRIRDTEGNLKACKEKLSGKCTTIESVSDEQSMSRIWEARNGALNRVMRLTHGSRKPIGLIEDTVVNPSLLHAYTQYLLQSYSDSKLDYVVYGHVGDGNLHTRPLIDISFKSEVDLIERLAQQVFDKVIRFGGTITGEHGDGLARVKYIPSVYGNEMFSVFLQVKKLFDPKFLLNPGKKIMPPVMP